MQSNFWAGSKNLDRHKTFWDMLKDKAFELHKATLNVSALPNLINRLHIRNLYFKLAFFDELKWKITSGIRNRIKD